MFICSNYNLEISNLSNQEINKRFFKLPFISLIKKKFVVAGKIRN